MRSGNNAVIVSFARTPIGKFCGSLSSLSATQLGSIAIKGAIRRFQPFPYHDPEKEHDSITLSSHEMAPWKMISEAFMGNVVSAGLGQAPCRQAVLGAQLSPTTVCTTVNKVCASGMKAVILASQAIQCHTYGATSTNPILIAGGMESMSNVPYYLSKSRKHHGGLPLGHNQLIDGIIHDGLWDVYYQQHMGRCAEKCAFDLNISREEQDRYAIESYQRAQHAMETGIFIPEIEPVVISSRKSSSSKTMNTPSSNVIIKQDEEPQQRNGSINMEKIQSLRPVFPDEIGHGTITAANASSLNDGAAAMILMSEQHAIDMNVKPLARIRGYGEAAQDPIHFSTSPALAISKALQHAGMTIDDIDCHEINEAFSVVVLANMILLDLDPAKVNMLGGAVSLGHPIGMSGCRIIGSLYSALKSSNRSIGCASICNGGGGASAVIIERMH